MKNLIAALCKARINFGSIKKDKRNDFTKSYYATLDSVLDSVIPALSENGLVVVQTIELTETNPILLTTLFHESGEMVSSNYPLPAVSDPQKLGAAVTYARRYSICALLNITADEDDDGNSSNQSSQSSNQQKQTRKVVTSSTQREQPKPSKPVEPEPEVEELPLTQHSLIQKFIDALNRADSAEKVNAAVQWLNKPKQWDAISHYEGVAELVATLETEALQRLSEPVAATNGKAPKKKVVETKTIEVADDEF